MTADAPAKAPDITMKTTVARLLEQHPQLEDLLIAQAPAFKRLKHPILRRTVARVTTIRQAAEVGGVDADALLATLRRAAGQSSAAEHCEETGAAVETLKAEPEWTKRFDERISIDADDLLEAGRTPFQEAFARARALTPTQLLEVGVSFKPAPMVRMLEKAGHRTALLTVGENRYRLLVAPGVS
jgi:hypothetical protein